MLNLTASVFSSLSPIELQYYWLLVRISLTNRSIIICNINIHGVGFWGWGANLQYLARVNIVSCPLHSLSNTENPIRNHMLTISRIYRPSSVIPPVKPLNNLLTILLLTGSLPF